MPGENCCIPGCYVYRNEEKYPDIGIFKLPMYSGELYCEWRQTLAGVLLRYRDPDKEKSLRRLIKEGRIWFCERHFKEEDIERTSESYIRS